MMAAGVSPMMASSEGQEGRSASNILNKDDFMRLLRVQLKHQDPLSPMQNHEFAAQLAQFGSLEQLQNMNLNLTESLRSGEMLNHTLTSTMATSLVGKDVEILDDQVRLDEGQAEISYLLHDHAQDVVVKISDVNGILVKTLELGPHMRGRGTVQWDGMDEHGVPFPPGTYSISVSAVDSIGNSVGAIGLSLGKVNAVRYRDGNALLVIENTEVPLSRLSGIVESR